jgi:pyruvate dehydrogenase (quinone)
MLLGELLTIAQYQLPVKIVLFNNHRLGMVQMEQESVGLPHYGCELKNPNFADLARVVGLKGIRVEDPADVRSGLKQALESDGPVLVDVVTDPNVLSIPPKATLKQAKGFAMAMAKMTFIGELDDVMDTLAAEQKKGRVVG